MLPVQPLSQHLAELGAAVAARTADNQPQPTSSRQQFGAARHASIERSLGEISLGQVQQPPQFSDVNHHDVGEVALNGKVANQPQTRSPLAQGASADNGIASGNYLINPFTTRPCAERLRNHGAIRDPSGRRVI